MKDSTFAIICERAELAELAQVINRTHDGVISNYGDRHRKYSIKSAEYGNISEGGYKPPPAAG